MTHKGGLRPFGDRDAMARKRKFRPFADGLVASQIDPNRISCVPRRSVGIKCGRSLTVGQVEIMFIYWRNHRDGAREPLAHQGFQRA
jgi:hypothetical protein